MEQPDIFKVYADVMAYNRDCRVVMEQMLNDNVTVDLTVTSPPYDMLRTYNGTSAWNADIFREIADMLYQITSDGGVVVWVVSDEVVKGSESGNSFRQALYFKETGFKLHDTMIYEKNSSSFPARKDGNRYTQIFEYMFVLCKGKLRTVNLICDKRNKWAGHTNWGMNTMYNRQGELTKTGNIKPVPEFSPRTNIWKYSVGFNVNKGKHPAVFPYKLAEDIIVSFSNEGDTVFDPFLGSGTTLFASLKNKRRFIGCEIDKTYFAALPPNLGGYLKRWKTNMDIIKLFDL